MASCVTSAWGAWAWRWVFQLPCTGMWRAFPGVAGGTRHGIGWLAVVHLGSCAMPPPATMTQGSDKERFNEIQQELSQLSTKFSNNLLDATKAFKKLLSDKADVEGLPASGAVLLSGRNPLAASLHRGIAICAQT